MDTKQHPASLIPGGGQHPAAHQPPTGKPPSSSDAAPNPPQDNTAHELDASGTATQPPQYSGNSHRDSDAATLPPQYSSPVEASHPGSDTATLPPQYSSPVEASHPGPSPIDQSNPANDDLYDAPPPSHPPPQYSGATEVPPEKAPRPEAAATSEAGPSGPPPPPQYDNPNAVAATPEKTGGSDAASHSAQQAGAATASAAIPYYPPPPTHPGASDEVPPPKPPRPQQAPKRRSLDDVEGGQYIRNPHKLIAYIVPFPKPEFKKGLFHHASGEDVPRRFLIYTPPPPPLTAPAEGEKESKVHKLQRKWQNEVREAKMSDAKVASWKGIKGRATKGISWAMNQTTSSNLDFINRMGGNSGTKQDDVPDKHSDDGHVEGETTKKTVGLEELVLVYPEGLPGTEEEIRTEFVNSMLRTKSKAQKDSVIATGLLPVAFAVDLLATLIWPFGGLVEVDGVWAANSIRGAKTARSVTKRLHSTGNAEKDDAKLRLSFTPSPRIDILGRYFQEECHKRDGKYFKSPGVPPSETEVLEAMGWSASAEAKNWEDEQWETREVKDDLKATMQKGAKEWDKWVKLFEKDPKKAQKK